MDASYCVRCKRKTKNINSKGFLTKNKKYLVKSVMFVNLRKVNLLVNNKLKVFYQIYSVRYQS